MKKETKSLFAGLEKFTTINKKELKKIDGGDSRGNFIIGGKLFGRRK